MSFGSRWGLLQRVTTDQNDPGVPDRSPTGSSAIPPLHLRLGKSQEKMVERLQKPEDQDNAVRQCLLNMTGMLLPQTHNNVIAI